MERVLPQRKQGSARCNGIELAYETFGVQTAQPVLLIMGLGSQMILWEDEFCDLLAARGFLVIRFDNRDVGLSTKTDTLGMPDIYALLEGKTVAVPYTLRDMAEDTVGLLDALDVGAAHVVGASMGGMIAQEIAISYPQRLHSLTSIMSTTGDPRLPGPRPEALNVLLRPYPTERERFVRSFVETWQVLGGDLHPMEESRVFNLAERFFERGVYPPGSARQLAAIIASGNRRERLASVRVPTLVIHGSDDPLVPVECGTATAQSIPGAHLKIIRGMGHALPPSVWPEIIDALAGHAGRSML